MSDSQIINLSGHLPYLRLSDSVSIPTYFLVSSGALIIALFFLLHRARVREIPRNLAIGSAIALMIGGFFGARLFHILFEEPAYYFQSPVHVLEVWRGGFVWYGGVAGGIITGLLYLKWRGENLLIWLDLYAPVAALGYGLGRMACFLSGCCFGEVCELPGHLLMRHPTQLYAIVLEFCVLGVLLRIEKRRQEPEVPSLLRAPGQVFTLWVMMHAIARIVMESFRADPRGPPVIGLSVATFISLILFMVATATFFGRRQRRLS